MASSTAAGDLMMDGDLDGGLRSLDSQAAGDLMMDGELAGLPGFSARQGEQEVHGVGMAIGWGATRTLASWPGCSRRGKRRPRREPLGTLYRQGLGYGEQQAARRAPLQFCCNPSE